MSTKDAKIKTCANPMGCIRLANGTDGIGYCMHCEDDVSNYLRVKGGPWGGPYGGGVFRNKKQAALSGVSEEQFNAWNSK